jgi:hypothetical protein
MLSKVTRHTPPELLEDFLAAVEWIASAGFAVERGRVSEYQRVLTKAVDRYESHGWAFEDQHHEQQVCTTLLETREFISIHRGLAGFSDSAALKEIPLLLKGPFLPNDELATSSSNRPRNIGFELYLAALFSAAGIQPIYGTNADLCFEHNGHVFFVEAKRPSVPHRSCKLIKEANKQLKQRLKSSKNEMTRGLIALDLTKVVNPNNRVTPIESAGHLDLLMLGEVERQIEALRSHWNDRRHPDVVGALLNFKLLTQFGPNHDLVTVRWVSFVQFSHDHAISGLHEKLNSVIRKIC